MNVNYKIHDKRVHSAADGGTGAPDTARLNLGSVDQSANADKKGGKKGRGGNRQLRPIAQPAGMRRRHWGLIASFFFIVLLPVTAIVLYLWLVAVDQYSSTTGFTVRQEEGGAASDLLGGLAQFTGASSGSDGDVLYEFIQSQEIVEKINDRVGLISLYSEYWDQDPVFALPPDVSLEELVSYWSRIVRIAYDQNTGLIEIRVLSFEPETAQRIAQEILAESQAMINALSETAREDALRYARSDLDEALSRLKDAREAMTSYRIRTQIFDPSADLQGRMGVLNNLQQQLAQALIDFDLLLENTSNANDPRLIQARQRITVIQDRIREERASFASTRETGNPMEEDYPTLIAEYESLTVDREFAEETYRAALAAMEVAKANASRQSRYLATYIQPTLSRSSEFPQRFVYSSLAALFLLLTWAIMALVYYSIRDRR